MFEHLKCRDEAGNVRCRRRIDIFEEKLAVQMEMMT